MDIIILVNVGDGIPRVVAFRESEESYAMFRRINIAVIRRLSAGWTHV